MRAPPPRLCVESDPMIPFIDLQAQRLRLAGTIEAAVQEAVAELAAELADPSES